ncbi:hypothetical protein CBL_10992 [Carabus blaptoides fortunei]
MASVVGETSRPTNSRSVLLGCGGGGGKEEQRSGDNRQCFVNYGVVYRCRRWSCLVVEVVSGDCTDNCSPTGHRTTNELLKGFPLGRCKHCLPVLYYVLHGVRTAGQEYVVCLTPTLEVDVGTMFPHIVYKQPSELSADTHLSGTAIARWSVRLRKRLWRSVSLLVSRATNTRTDSLGSYTHAAGWTGRAPGGVTQCNNAYRSVPEKIKILQSRPMTTTTTKVL